MPLDRPDFPYTRVRDPMLLVAVIVVAHLPFLLDYFYSLWRYKPHYEFFPLILAAAGWITWKRWPRGPVEQTPMTRLACLSLLSMGLAGMAAAVLLYSPWVAAMAALFSAGGLILGLAGRAAIGPLAPVWLMLCIVIRPPFRLDDEFIRFLQHFTAESSSALLDALRVDHLLTGNVFRLPDRELFVAEACSGVHSQLALFAVCVLFVIVLRRHPIHWVLLLAAAVFWSCVVNVMRVTFVVLAAARWGADLSTGWTHEAIGYSLVGLGFLLLFSTDQLLLSLLAVVRDPCLSESAVELAAVPLGEDPLSRIWNRVMRGRWEAAFLFEQPVTAPGPWRLDSVCRSHRAAALFGSLGLLQVLCLLLPGESHIAPDAMAESFAESWLPEQVNGWILDEYRVQQRDRSSDEGQYSRIWLYRNQEHIAHVSVDFPFLGWHELTRCYTSQGWLEVRREVFDVHGAQSDLGPFVQVELRRMNGMNGLLYFSMYDGAGRAVVPRSGHWSGLRAKLVRNPLLAFLAPDGPTIDSAQTTLQIQLFTAAGLSPTDTEKEQARTLYLEMRGRLRERWLDPAPGGAR